MRPTLTDRLMNRVLRILIGGAMRLPYERRVAFVGWFTRSVLAPLAGYNRRSRANLRLVFPEMPDDVRDRIARAAADNAGRTLVEIFSGPEFIARAAAAPVTGPGLAAIEEARSSGRPVLLITGHFGNYDVVRAWFAGRGVEVGGLYKPLANERFNDFYEERISEVNGPIFERGRRGLGRMVAHIRNGGLLFLLFDQRIGGAEPIDFLGQPALTALSAAEMALKYGALLVPVYGLRQPDGIGFEFVAEAPVPATDARKMMQAVSDSLAAQVRAHPEQYFWIHRRWKL